MSMRQHALQPADVQARAAGLLRARKRFDVRFASRTVADCGIAR